VLLVLWWFGRNDNELHGGGILDTPQLMYHKSDVLQNYIFNYIKSCDIVKQSQTIRYKDKAILNYTLKYKFQTTVSFTICCSFQESLCIFLCLDEIAFYWIYIFL